jgi:hypothetical protein
MPCLKPTTFKVYRTEYTRLNPAFVLFLQKRFIRHSLRTALDAQYGTMILAPIDKFTSIL